MHVTLLLIFLCISQLNAALNLSNTFGDNMVLQRSPAQANIFGWAAAGSTVTVTFNNQNIPATVTSDGNWTVALPATPAGGPYTIGFSASNGDKASLNNVLFGDIWLCGGQSNMQFTVDMAWNATEEVQQANNYPNIRVFSVGQGTAGASSPLSQLGSVAMPWSIASNATIGAGQWTEFSAVCWFTGKYLFDQYQVPLGLISSNWGGTTVLAWSSPSALQSCNIGPGGQGIEATSVLYNAMIFPFLQQSIKGVLWYQGEQDVGYPTMYQCVFPAMITDWRKTFAGSQDFPFFFVQLSTWGPNGDGDTTIADLRAAQLAALALPDVGFATAADLGDEFSPAGNIHPRDKQDVARRLTLAARNIAYEETDVIWEGPMFSSANVSLSGSTAVVSVTWEMFGAESLIVREGVECGAEFPASDCENWGVQIAGGAWFETNVTTVTGNVVQIPVQISSGQRITGVRYGYSDWPIMNLYNEQNLPAIPFQYFLL